MGGTPILPMGSPVGTTPPAAGDEWRSGSQANLTTFAFRDVQPPSPIYIQRDDLLVLQGNTTLSGGDTLTLNARLLLPTLPQGSTPSAAVAGQPQGAQPNGPGTIVNIQIVLALTAQGTTYTRVQNLAEGYLLSLAIVPTNATSFGQTYASAYIGRGAPGGATPAPALMLVADYPTATIPVGWPGVPIRQSAQGQGTILAVQITTPAAGAPFIYTAITGLRSRVRSLRFQFTTSATVANRDVIVSIQDAAAHVIADMPANALITASTTSLYTVALGGVYVNDTNLVTTLVPFLQVDLLGGWKITGTSNNLQAADQFSNIWMELETWIA